MIDDLQGLKYKQKRMQEAALRKGRIGSGTNKVHTTLEKFAGVRKVNICNISYFLYASIEFLSGV